MRMIKDGQTIAVGGAGSRSRYSADLLRESLHRRLARTMNMDVIWLARSPSPSVTDPRKMEAAAGVLREPKHAADGRACFHTVEARYGRSAAQAVCSVTCRDLDEVLRLHRSPAAPCMMPRGENRELEWTRALEMDSLRQSDPSAWFRTLFAEEQILLFRRALWYHEDLLLQLRRAGLVHVLALGDAALRETAIRLSGRLAA